MAKQTYEKVGWQNEASGNTPVSAENLEHMDSALKYLYDEGATSKDIFICGENQTKEDAPEDAKIVFENNIVGTQASEVVNSMDGNEVSFAPSVYAVKNYINNRTLGVQYIPTSQTSQAFTPTFNCYAEIYYSISGWAYGGGETKPTITCTQGNAELIADLPNGTKGHDTIPDGMFIMKVFKLNKGIEYKFSFSGTSGGTFASGSFIKLIPRYEED